MGAVERLNSLEIRGSKVSWDEAKYRRFKDRNWNNLSNRAQQIKIEPPFGRGDMKVDGCTYRDAVIPRKEDKEEMINNQREENINSTGTSNQQNIANKEGKMKDEGKSIVVQGEVSQVGKRS